MSEEAAIERVDEPVTVDDVVDDLRDLGVEAGDDLLVHSSLSALGWIAGGPQAVVDALQAVLTPEGTLAMPTFTSQYTDPADWEHPPVPPAWVERIPAAMPPFRPAVSPTRGMGAVPECFRTFPGVHRSDHPTVSFAAWGQRAAALVADHPLEDPLGEDSPLARLYDRDADVLMLGTDHRTNTSLHLAEYRADLDAGRTTTPAKVLRDGEPVVVSVAEQDLSTADFEAVEAAFEAQVGTATGQVGMATGTIGAATARLAGQRDLVDFAEGWFERNR